LGHDTSPRGAGRVTRFESLRTVSPASRPCQGSDTRHGVPTPRSETSSSSSSEPSRPLPLLWPSFPSAAATPPRPRMGDLPTDDHLFGATASASTEARPRHTGTCRMGRRELPMSRAVSRPPPPASPPKMCLVSHVGSHPTAETIFPKFPGRSTRLPPMTGEHDINSFFTAHRILPSTGVP
jgi:hypothetical protein